MSEKMNEWIDVMDDEPMSDKKYNNISIDVMTLNDQKKERKGWLHYPSLKWYDQNGFQIKNVVAWRSL